MGEFLLFLYVEEGSEPYTDKKENQIFLIYKESQNGAVAKSYMTITASSYMSVWSFEEK